jgi:serine/threonine protein kinase
MPLAATQVLNNRYRIVALLGQGGFGAVYRAWDLNLKRPCAVKENLDTSAEAQRQFEREAELLANLSHPNLPRVLDSFLLPSLGQYLVMDFVDGEDLQALLDRLGPLPEAEVLPWIAQVCDALTYLHTQTPPVIHRDIKPANIKVTPQGRVMLVDFGIAKVYDPHLKTTMGARAVTPGFSPPEQYGQGRTDGRTDIYALGATLYTLLSGPEPPESVQRMVGSPLPPLRSISSMTADAINKAMAIDPSKRFQTAVDFSRAIQPVSSPPPAPQSNNFPQRPIPTNVNVAGSQKPVTILPFNALATRPLLYWLPLLAVVGCVILPLFIFIAWSELQPTSALPDIPTYTAIPTILLPETPTLISPVDVTATNEAWLLLDDDGDGLLNGQEVEIETETDRQDTDGDNLTDYDEVMVYSTNPLNVDTDGDTLSDGQEVTHPCLSPITTDTNLDGMQDHLDTNPCQVATSTRQSSNTPTNTPTTTPTRTPTVTIINFPTSSSSVATPTATTVIIIITLTPSPPPTPE